MATDSETVSVPGNDKHFRIIFYAHPSMFFSCAPLLVIDWCLTCVVVPVLS